MDLTLARQGELGTRDASHKTTASVINLHSPSMQLITMRVLRMDAEEA